MRRVIYPCVFDLAMVSVYDVDRINAYGEMYCVAEGIPPEEVDQRWDEYVQRRTLDSE